MEKYDAPPRVTPVVETGGVVVLVSPCEADGYGLRRILDDARSHVEWFPTCNAALAFLREHQVGVVIANAELPDGCWIDVLDAISPFTPRPSLIVASRLADERLWAEVLNRGGYDVLLTPFESEDVRRVSSAAWRAWKQQWAPHSPPRPKAAAAADSHPKNRIAGASSGA